jgi:phytoene synthase
VAATAEQQYAEAQAALAECPRSQMRPAALMLCTYRALLHLLLARGFRCLDEPVRIAAWKKTWLLLRHGLAGQ